MSGPASPRRDRGITLIELIISIVVIGVALAGVLSVMNLTTARSADPVLVEQANAIAQSYLEEVLLRPFCDPNDFSIDCFADCSANACAACSGSTVEGGGAETRATFDDVCDYDGLTDTGATDQSGTPIASLASYVVQVSVDDDSDGNGDACVNGLNASAGRCVRVDVSVAHTGGNVRVDLSGYRVNY